VDEAMALRPLPDDRVNIVVPGSLDRKQLCAMKTPPTAFAGLRFLA
jgi:hypothetical protein